MSHFGLFAVEMNRQFEPHSGPTSNESPRGGTRGRGFTSSIPEGTCYGLMLDFRVEEDGFIEVRYSIQKTELDVTKSPIAPGQVKVTDLDVEHYFVGGAYQWETSTMALPFVSADVGGVRFDAPGFHGDTSFAFSLGGEQTTEYGSAPSRWASRQQSPGRQAAAGALLKVGQD